MNKLGWTFMISGAILLGTAAASLPSLPLVLVLCTGAVANGVGHWCRGYAKAEGDAARIKAWR